MIHNHKVFCIFFFWKIENHEVIRSDVVRNDSSARASRDNLLLSLRRGKCHFWKLYTYILREKALSQSRLNIAYLLNRGAI